MTTRAQATSKTTFRSNVRNNLATQLSAILQLVLVIYTSTAEITQEAHDNEHRHVDGEIEQYFKSEQ